MLMPWWKLDIFKYKVEVIYSVSFIDAYYVFATKGY